MDDLTSERWPGGSAWREARRGAKALQAKRPPDDRETVLERRRILNEALEPAKVSGVSETDRRSETSHPQDTVQT